MYFPENLLLYSQAMIRQNKYIVIMKNEVSTKTVNFKTRGAEDLVLGVAILLSKNASYL